MRLFCLAILLLSCLHPLCGQEGRDSLLFRVMTYNVENLFDCRDDSLTHDEEFLPQSIRHWNYRRYRQKLDHVGRVIAAAGEWQLPALVALCEVENDTVLRDLTRYSLLHEAGYRYLMTHSPDERGIDVALLYQRHLFKPLAHCCLSVPRPTPSARPTRDILYVSGLLLNQDTLDVFVTHFPSRSGGAKETEPYRLLAARQVKTAIDSIYKVRRNPQILLMGDLNEYPTGKAIRQILQADIPPTLPDSLSPHRLYHLMARKIRTQKPSGSYKYQGIWYLLDHIIVSGNLLRPSSPFHTDESKAGIFSPSFLLTEDARYGGLQPYRTYYGMQYQGGYSDHLPVVAEFTLIY
ncbi:MAG: endonuclease [Bacteroides sp.]|nr:endonuclease [Bacteroides sp.]